MKKFQLNIDRVQWRFDPSGWPQLLVILVLLYRIPAYSWYFFWFWWIRNNRTWKCIPPICSFIFVEMNIRNIPNSLLRSSRVKLLLHLSILFMKSSDSTDHLIQNFIWNPWLISWKNPHFWHELRIFSTISPRRIELLCKSLRSIMGIV